MSTASALRPTRAVLAHIEAGAGSVAEIARRTGLDIGVVGLAVERLVSSGHLSAQKLQTGCPDGGCSACPSGTAAGTRCGMGASSAGGGPVMLSLSVPRR